MMGFVRNFIIVVILALCSYVTRSSGAERPGVAALYSFRSDRDRNCDDVGSRIASGTFEAIGLTEIGVDEKFRRIVNSSLDSEEIYGEIRNIMPMSAGRLRAGGVPWMLVNSPNPAAKRAAFHFQMQSAWTYLEEWRKGSLDESDIRTLSFFRLLEVLEKRFVELSDLKYVSSPPYPLISILEKKNFRAEVDTPVARSGAVAVCFRSFPLSIQTCAKDFVSSMLEYAPKFYGNENGQFYWFLDPLMREVFEDSVYERPILLTAVALIKKIRSAESTGEVQGNLVSELEFILSREGLTKADPKKALLWKMLAAYATHGATFSILEPFLDRRVAARLAAFEIISAAINYLDAYAEMDGGRYFSLPSFLVGNCRITKPYHFWLSAFVARNAVVQRKRSVGSALVEAHMLGFMYEFGARSNGRLDIREIFKNGGLYSVHNDSLRLSILAKDLGALYGANFDKYLGDKASVDTGEKFRALRRAARAGTCSTEIQREISASMDRPLLRVFSDLRLEAKVLGCFEKTLAVHALKHWKEFTF